MISVSNLGVDSLDWTAETAAEWLVLRKINNRQLSVTANVAGLAPNQFHTATITITDDQQQTFDISVTLLKGGDPEWDSSDSSVSAPTTVYLPFLAR